MDLLRSPAIASEVNMVKLSVLKFLMYPLLHVVKNVTCYSMEISGSKVDSIFHVVFCKITYMVRFLERGITLIHPYSRNKPDRKRQA